MSSFALYAAMFLAVLVWHVAAMLLMVYGWAKVCLGMSAFFVRRGLKPHWSDRFLERYVRWLEGER